MAAKYLDNRKVLAWFLALSGLLLALIIIAIFQVYGLDKRLLHGIRANGDLVRLARTNTPTWVREQLRR